MAAQWRDGMGCAACDDAWLTGGSDKAGRRQLPIGFDEMRATASLLALRICRLFDGSRLVSGPSSETRLMRGSSGCNSVLAWAGVQPASLAASCVHTRRVRSTTAAACPMLPDVYIPPARVVDQ